MATGGWVAELDTKEHKNWVMIGSALNIVKNGITTKITKEMEVWYQSLISSPPLQSLPFCACAPLTPKCPTCVTWEAEMKRHHKSGRPKICWDNSDRKQWGSPTGAWEIAKLFMSTLGSRTTDVVDAETTDIGGLLNLLEWCPFNNPPVSRTVLISARDECRNHWAHAPKQEIPDADLLTIFGHLNKLLTDAVFSSDKAAQQSSKDLQDLFHKGLVNVRESEIEALHLLRQSLVADLTKCQDDLFEVKRNVLTVDAKMKEFEVVTQKDLSDVKKEEDLQREEICKLAQDLDKLKDVMAHHSNDLSTVMVAVDDFNGLLNIRDDLKEVIEAIQDDVEIVKSYLNVMQSKLANIDANQTSLKHKVIELQKEVSILQTKVMEVLEKGQATAEQNEGDDDIVCTAPSRLPSFTARKSALRWLERNLVPEIGAQNGAQTCCRTKTICGLGGCGKTSLAVEFTWIYKSRFPGGVFWINGESDENITKSVVETLALKNIPTPETSNIDETLNRFLTWLSNKELPWLLVVDNADELQDKTCPTGVKKICKGPWQRNGKSPKQGHILLTTRQNAKDARAFLRHSSEDFLALQCFSEEEGALFLMKRTSLEENSLDQDAIALTKELGALPLALEQAAAFITASPIPLSFADYLEQYRVVKLRLLKEQPVMALSMESQHRLSVHTTWQMNFEYVKDQCPAAASMMRIAAFLESENVPIDVINPGFPELDQKDLREKACSKIETAILLKVLSSYSLFSVNCQKGVFHVHKLLQEVVKDSLTVSQKVEALVAATRLLHFALLGTTKSCSKSSKLRTVGYISELKDKERRIATALILNFRKLKNHIENLIASKEANFTHLCNDNVFHLCNLVATLIEGDVFFITLVSDLKDFQLKVQKERGNSDPNLLLAMMTSASISKRNVPGSTNYSEAKRMAHETVQKLAELENAGFVIESDIKYRVLEHMASYYAHEHQWEKNYKALLELEQLPLSDEKVVHLQIFIGRAENFVSAGNFERVLKRHLKALELARKVYPPDHPELLRVLQFVTTHFYNDEKLQEARVYAEELLQIAKKQPPASDYYIKGITSALSVISYFDPCRTKEILCKILADRWPDLYKQIQRKEVNGSINVATVTQLVDESSCEHASIVLLELLHCFSAQREMGSKINKQDGHFYLKIGEALVSLRKKEYEDTHPDVEEGYFYLAMVHEFLGNQEKALKLKKQSHQYYHTDYTTSESHHYFSQTRCDHKVLAARSFKDLANDFFKSGNYSRALDLYNSALALCPKDAKLLTNRTATYVKLSERQGHAVHDKQIHLESALQDTNKAITADPSWVKGYYWRAVCFSKLGQKGPCLAAAAVARHLFPLQCTDIPAVVKHFGCYNINVIGSVNDLHHAVKSEGSNLVILVKEGRYELLKPLKVPANIVIVGIGKVQIICTKDVPLYMDETVYFENLLLTPSMESIKMIKEKAKENLTRGQLDQALSLYSEALTLCPENPHLLAARASTYLKSAEGTNNMSERESLLELALKDSEYSLRVDPSFLPGHSTKATSLVELRRKNEALAAAAVFKHLSSGRDVSSVTKYYGKLQIQLVESSDRMCRVLQGITEPKGVNQIVLIKEGEYLLEKSVDIKPPIIVVGLGKVTISCKTGTPFQFRQEHFVENVELYGGCYKFN